MIAKSSYLDLVAGKFGQTSAADLAAAFQALRASPAGNHLVVHFHGGLVSRAAAASLAEGLLPSYTGGNAYPLFFIWNSDLATTLSANLDEIAEEPVFKRLVLRIVQLALGKLGEKADGRGDELELDPLIEMPKDLAGLAAYATDREPAAGSIVEEPLTPRQQAQVDKELRSDVVLKRESLAILAGVQPPEEGDRGGAPVAPAKTRISKQVIAEMRAEDARGARDMAGLLTLARYAAAILVRVVARYARGRDHGLYTTVVEEVLRELYVESLAIAAWGLMKGDTADAFGPDPKLFGGSAFVAELARWWQPGRRITLVGHSTGAIYIGNLLRRADELLPPEAKVDVVFLAPACTFAFMAECLPVFKRRVDHLRMFALADEAERRYWEVPAIYRGSLLYLVSGLCEPEVDAPIMGMQRYHAAAGPYDRREIHDVVAYLANRCVWSIAKGTAGSASSAERHGAFDEDPLTRESLKHILLTGF